MAVGSRSSCENQRPFRQPARYDPHEFELLRRYLKAAGSTLKAGALMSLVPDLPNGKCDVNSIGPLSTNLLDGSSWEYPDASYHRRREIWDEHLHYTQGLLYFLAHDPAVPGAIRYEMNRWGLCEDEFSDTDHWPPPAVCARGPPHARRVLDDAGRSRGPAAEI